NCGICGNACMSAAICMNGSCQCPPGTIGCNGSCVNNSTDNNCGSCGNACASGTTCVSGTCQVVCPAGTTNCSGFCANTNNDQGNCGACGNRCTNDNPSCCAGHCV